MITRSLVSGCLLLIALLLPGGINARDRHLIAFYNLENLFDTIDSQGVDDLEFTPGGERQWTSERYLFKIDQVAKVLSMIGPGYGLPGSSIIGLCEVENIGVVRDLLNSRYLRDKGYSIVHFDSPDRRGIDVALLYKPRYFTVSNSVATPLIIYGDGGRRVYTRDQLLVSGIFDGEPMHFIVNHWPSRLGGEERSQPLRAEAARLTRSLVDSIAMINRRDKIIVMGDLNDNPVDSSIAYYLGALSSRDDIKSNQLYNATARLYEQGEGTLRFRGNWNMFDQMIVSGNFVKRRGRGYKLYKPGVFKEPFMMRQEGRFTGYPFRTFSGGEFIGGYSDHLPVYIIIERK